MKIRVMQNQQEEIEGLYPEYPYVLHRADLSDTHVPWHWHEELEFNYVLEGRVKVTTIARSCTFKKGEAFFINTNVLCTMEKEESCVLDSHLFHPIFLGGHFKSIFETKYLSPVLRDKKIELVDLRGENERQQSMIQKLRKASALQLENNTEFQTRNIFSEVWLLLLEEIQNRKPEDFPDRPVTAGRIQTMLSFIRQNYSEKISLQDIADSAAVSRRECLRCFQECIHQTPFEYILDFRIEAAKKLLRATDLPIVDVALQTGFSEAAYFSKIFKKVSGRTPREFRKLYRTS